MEEDFEEGLPGDVEVKGALLELVQEVLIEADADGAGGFGGHPEGGATPREARGVVKKITVEMSRDQALALDLLWCRCGHRPNNHFEWDKKVCAHCPAGKCQGYEEVILLPRVAEVSGGGSVGV